MATIRSSHSDVKQAHLRSLLVRLDGVLVDVRVLFAELSEEQLTWRPKPHKWCIAETINHLMVVGDLYYPRIREAIRYAREHNMQSDDDYRPGLFARWFIRSVGPEGKRRMRTAKIFAPPPVSYDVTLAPRFLKQQEELATLIRQADGFDINSVKFPSPAIRLLRFTIGEGLTMQVAHIERHVQQAKQLRDAQTAGR